jgi:alanine racemase
VNGVRHTRACVRLAALEANCRTIAGRLAAGAAAAGRPAPALIAVVKANAYGHGAVAVARVLERAGAAMLACADIEEGVALREGGVRLPILVFGALGISDLEGVFTYRLTPTISTPSAAASLESAAARRGVTLGCQLEIDTGMHRLGFRHDNLQRTLPQVVGSAHLRIEAVYTHFATAEDPAHPLFEQQRARFERVRAEARALGLAPRAWHAANSAALLRDARVWYDAVRPGLLLYGVSPTAAPAPAGIAPVLGLESRVVAVKGLRPGEGVSYGWRFVADTPRSIAVVPAGYADGLDTRMSGRASVLVRGRRAPVVGAVCMDMLMVDVTGMEVAPGDAVVVLGRQGTEEIGVRELADATGTIPYEWLCRVGSRIERVYDDQ